jgi:hypothetical protein
VAGREKPAGVNPMGGWPEEAKPIRAVLTWCGTASVNQAGRAILAAAADRKRDKPIEEVEMLEPLVAADRFAPEPRERVAA